MCCNLLEINEISETGVPFRKAGWTLCAHCETGNENGGCTIYLSRPKTCRAYRCAWMLGFGDEDDSPEVTMVLVNPEESEGYGPMLNFIELIPGVVRFHEPAKNLLEKARQDRQVNAISIISSMDAPRVVYVRSARESGEWNNEIHGSHREQFPDGIAVTDWRWESPGE